MASLIAQGGHYEWTVTNGTNTYGSANIADGTIVSAISKDGSVGNVIAKQLNLRLWNAVIDTSQPISLKVTEYDVNNTPGNEYNKGVFLIDTVAASPYSEFVEVTAFDALLKAEVVYLFSGTWVEKSASDVVEEIAEDIGVEVDSTTLDILTSFPKMITQAPSMGENGTTERQMLSVIATMYGGNFIINDENELELRLLMTSAGFVMINPSGLFMVADYNFNQLTNPSLVGVDANGNFIAIPRDQAQDTDIVVFIDWKGMTAVDELGKLRMAAQAQPTVEVGDEVVRFDVSPTEHVKRIELQANGSSAFRAPSGLTDDEWEALGGRVVTINMPIMASQDLADALLEQLGEIDYVPHTATGVYIDPTLPLGTGLHIRNDYVMMLDRTLNVNTLATSDLSAQPTQELQSNYPYIDPVVREARQKAAETYAAIQVMGDQIRSEVYTKGETDERIASQVSQSAENLTITFETQLQEGIGAANDYTDSQTEDLRTYFDFSENGMEIGKSDSPFKVNLSNSELAFTGESGEKAAWINSNQLYINEAVIPASTGRWVTYASADGHLQTRWVSN